MGTSAEHTATLNDTSPTVNELLDFSEKLGQACALVELQYEGIADGTAGAALTARQYSAFFEAFLTKHARNPEIEGLEKQGGIQGMPRTREALVNMRDAVIDDFYPAGSITPESRTALQEAYDDAVVAANLVPSSALGKHTGRLIKAQETLHDERELTIRDIKAFSKELGAQCDRLVTDGAQSGLYTPKQYSAMIEELLTEHRRSREVLNPQGEGAFEHTPETVGELRQKRDALIKALVPGVDVTAATMTSLQDAFEAAASNIGKSRGFHIA